MTGRDNARRDTGDAAELAAMLVGTQLFGRLDRSARLQLAREFERQQL